MTRRIIADVQRRTQVPVQYLVNTHWYNDRVLGNGEYRDAFPGLVIVSTTATRDSLNSRVAQNVAQAIRELPAAVARTRQVLANEKTDSGVPLSASEA